jgi:hypothetical protein
LSPTEAKKISSPDSRHSPHRSTGGSGDRSRSRSPHKIVLSPDGRTISPGGGSRNDSTILVGKDN